MINGHTKIYGILGRPVAHSLSPAMHNAAFRELRLNAVYVAFPVTSLPQAVAGLKGLDIKGVSVTIPFKEEIIPLLDELDPQAARIGAVNTVVNRDGRLCGYNTDWLGALHALKAKTGLKGEHVLLLGAGGAARAIAFGILEEGGRVTLTDLDGPRAAALALDLKVEAIPLTAVAQCPATILVNATPVGMAPNLDDIPINPELLGRYPIGDGYRLSAAGPPGSSGKQNPRRRHPRRPADAHPPGHRGSSSCGPAGRRRWRLWSRAAYAALT